MGFVTAFAKREHGWVLYKKKVVGCFYLRGVWQLSVGAFLGNDFCKKVTYRAEEDVKDETGKVVEKGEKAKSILNKFRNDYYPRIAVTVDMIASAGPRLPMMLYPFNQKPTDLVK